MNIKFFALPAGNGEPGGQPPRLRYTDAPAVSYVPSGGSWSLMADDVPLVVAASVKRKPCPLAGSCCPVPDDCHLCGPTKEELEAEKMGGPVYPRRRYGSVAGAWERIGRANLLDKLREEGL